MTIEAPQRAEFARSIRAELNTNLLPFWHRRVIDDQYGGFVGALDFTGQVAPDAPKGVILNARILWTFAALARCPGSADNEPIALRAFDYLEQHFRDRQHGGYYWELRCDGRPIDQLKRIYGQAFCIYALSEYYRTFHDARARDAALTLFQLLEKHAHDAEYGGYFEVCDTAWAVARGQRLSAKDLASPKSMNTHLHLLEAFTNLYRVTRDQQVGQRLRELLDLFGKFILDHKQGHLHHFFEDDWTVTSASYTYGHDIEAAWLLGEAAGVLGDPNYVQDARQWSKQLVMAVVCEAMDLDRGVAYAGRKGEVVDYGKEWWPQAEAVVGLLHGWRLLNSERLFEMALGVWHFVQEQIVDRTNGEWHWRIGPEGAPDPTQPKVSAWKGPYHNVRMCLETLRRLDPVETYAEEIA